MKKTVVITEIYQYEVEVEAKSNNEAISKAQKIYENPTDGYYFDADATSFKEAYFSIKL